MNSASRCGRSETSASSSRFLGGDQAAAWSSRQLLEPLPDQRGGVGALAGVARGGGDRGGGLRLAVAEIDQRRDRIGDRTRRAVVFERAGELHDRRIERW